MGELRYKDFRFRNQDTVLFRTIAEGTDREHELERTEAMLNLKAEAERHGFKFHFKYNRAHHNLIPDATVIFERDKGYLLR